MARIYRLAAAAAVDRVRLRQQAAVAAGVGLERQPEDLAQLQAAVVNPLAVSVVEPGRVELTRVVSITALVEAGVRRRAWRQFRALTFWVGHQAALLGVDLLCRGCKQPVLSPGRLWFLA